MGESCAKCRNKCMNCKLKAIRRLETDARAARDRGRLEEAEELMLEALRLEAETNLPLVGAGLRNALGIIYAHRGDWSAALSCCADATIPGERFSPAFSGSDDSGMRRAA